MAESGTRATALPAGSTNAVGRMLRLLGDEWTLLILQQSLLGATRYGDFTTRLPISHAVLADRLRILVADGLLTRRTYQLNPPREEYLTTARSRALWPVLLSIWEWERHWVPEQAHRLPTMHHAVCDEDFTPMLVCQACGDAVTEKHVSARWGPSGSWARSVPESSTRRRSDSSQRSGRAGLFPQTMTVFGNRWAAALLIAALLGATRFSQFQQQLGAPPSSVAARLRVFCDSGVLTGSAEYHLTEKGRAFFPVLVAVLQWAQRWFRAPEGPAVLLTHDTCGQAFTGLLACDQCAGVLTGVQVGVG